MYLYGSNYIDLYKVLHFEVLNMNSLLQYFESAVDKRKWTFFSDVAVVFCLSFSFSFLFSLNLSIFFSYTKIFRRIPAIKNKYNSLVSISVIVLFGGVEQVLALCSIELKSFLKLENWKLFKCFSSIRYLVAHFE